MASRKPSGVSAIAWRMGRRVRAALRAEPDIIGGDFGLSDRINFDQTSAGDTDALRKARMNRARQQANALSSRLDNSRRARNYDYREMEREVPELRNSKSVLVDFVFGGDVEHDCMAEVEIEYSASARPEVRAACAEIATLCRFGELLPGATDEAIQFGDSFSELIYRPNQLIAQKPLVPAEDNYVVWNEYGVLEGYIHKPLNGDITPLLPWQVAHLALDRKRGNKYGDSNWLAARKLWRAEQANLDVLGILTLLRAAARKSVTYAVPDDIPEDEIWEHVADMARGGWAEDVFDGDGNLVRRIASRLELDDIIYPHRASVDPPKFHDEPEANLAQLVETLKYYQERYFVATGVPAGLAGMERNVNARSTLEHQGLFFVRKVRSIQRQVARFAMEILVKGLMAKKIYPQKGEFSIKMPRVSTFDAKVAATVDRIKAQTIKLLAIDGGLDLAWVLGFALHIEPEEAEELAAKAGASGNVRPDEAKLLSILPAIQEDLAFVKAAMGDVVVAVPDIT